jgi:hypothetical protein
MKWITRERPKIDRIACRGDHFSSMSPRVSLHAGGEVMRLPGNRCDTVNDIPGVELGLA